MLLWTKGEKMCNQEGRYVQHTLARWRYDVSFSIICGTRIRFGTAIVASVLSLTTCDVV